MYCSFEGNQSYSTYEEDAWSRTIPLSTQQAPAPGIIADCGKNGLVNRICFSRSDHVRSREPQLSIVFHKDLPCLRMVGVPSPGWLATHETRKREEKTWGA